MCSRSRIHQGCLYLSSYGDGEVPFQDQFAEILNTGMDRECCSSPVEMSGNLERRSLNTVQAEVSKNYESQTQPIQSRHRMEAFIPRKNMQSVPVFNLRDKLLQRFHD